MPKTGSIGVGTKYSNAQTTPRSATTVPLSKFNAEKDAKNMAYHFILANGLLGQFRDFCAKHHGQDHQAECARILSNK